MIIIDKAKELGIALSESDEFRRMLAARTQLEGNPAVRDMLKDFQKKQREISDILSEDDPDHDLIAALTNDIDNMQNTLLLNPVFAELVEAQNDFQKLMNRVNKVIAECIGMDASQNGTCEGSCSSCSGCKH
ncbi:MAG: hypothetical protein BWY11_00625 [Firmicutes bacterium ADurb.Bin182]|nr:MAG: hypothetical protein BWY11_00625 [Firmicutes bacterium ADurb.Bin182]